MLKNGEKTHFKKLAVWTPHDFQSISDHFSALCMKKESIHVNITEILR